MRAIQSLSLLSLIFGIGVSTATLAESHSGKPVGITADLMSLSVMHNGKPVTIQRNQDNEAVINPDFAKTSRACPPFCIQPMTVAEGVETLGESEILDYLAKVSAGDSSILVVDSRTADWVKKGTIPGSVNIPWTSLVPAQGATTEGIIKVMQENFDVSLANEADVMDVDEAITDGDPAEVFDYSHAKTLVLFCNGMWCGQSPASIKTLLKYGYPPEKLKYYRGGMQTWEILGLTTIKP
jgi:rhodanese-related sulfurtransferase